MKSSAGEQGYWISQRFMTHIHDRDIVCGQCTQIFMNTINYEYNVPL
jgi:hypothetical protein